MARYTPDGSLDSSFGDGGRVLTGFPAFSAHAMAVAIDKLGRVLAAGSATVETGNRFALARYNPDGTLDSSFGSGGRVLTNFSSTEHDEARSVAIDGFGRIVAAGVAGSHGGANRFAVARYNDNGTLDSSFSDDGRVLTDFFTKETEAANGLAIDKFGRIVAAGTAVEGAISLKPGQFAVARYENNGSLDRSFGGDGKVLTNLGSVAVPRARAVAIDGLSRIIVAGFASPGFA